MTDILQISDLNKTYQRGDRETEAVKDLSFAAKAGEILGILGPNGSGKTTTLKSIAGLIGFDKGNIVVSGYDNVKQRKQMLFQLGAVLEGARNVYWRLSPRENIIYFAGLKGMSRTVARQRARQLLDILNLSDKTHEEVRNLSKGMQQKVAVACAIVHQPALILLDEPTLGLDVEIVRTMKSWLRELVRANQGAILITSHDLDFIEEVCDRVIIIDNGAKLAEASVDELRARHNPQKTIVLTLKEKILECDIEVLNRFGEWRVSTIGDKTELKSISSELDFLYPTFAALAQRGYALEDVVVKKDSLEELFLNLIHR